MDDQRLLNAMADAATKAGATVVSQIRYKFGQESPPGCTAVVMLDESHCSVHTYADLGLVAMDVFTCGSTDPMEVWNNLRTELDLRNATVRMVGRFETADVLEAL
jgi:S-adenosylmethionine decarboxylase